MTYDPLEALAAFKARTGLGFPLLHDENHRHVDALGIRNEKFSPDHKAYGVPHPGIMFVDPQGKLIRSFAQTDHRQRPHLGEVLAEVRKFINRRR